MAYIKHAWLCRRMGWNETGAPYYRPDERAKQYRTVGCNAFRTAVSKCCACTQTTLGFQMGEQTFYSGRAAGFACDFGTVKHAVDACVARLIFGDEIKRGDYQHSAHSLPPQTNTVSSTV